MSTKLTEKLINTSARGYPIIKLNAARIEVYQGNVVYSQKEESFEKTYNIPYLNTAVLILGYGTSVSQKAAILLAKAKTLVLFVDSSYNVHSMLMPEEGYLSNKYNQRLIENLYVKNKRVDLAKKMLLKRLEFNEEYINNIEEIEGIYNSEIQSKIENYKQKIVESETIEQMLVFEGNIMKTYYREFNKSLGIEDNDQSKEIKRRTIIINYKCYALASVVLTSLGLSYSLNVIHGRTRQGSLKFDIADIIKGLSTPIAILSLIDQESRFYTPFNSNKETDNIFSKKVIQYFEEKDFLTKLFKLTIDTLEINNA